MLQHYNVASLLCCGIIMMWTCSAAASRACNAAASRAYNDVAMRACTVAAPRCHRHRHKAHGQAAAWWPLTLRCRFPSTDSVRWLSSVGLSPVELPSVGPPSCRPAPYVMPSYAYCPTSCRHAVLHPAILRPTFSSNIYLTSVQYLCVTSYSQQRTLFFKLCVVLEFCS